jgi:hypothetical protein
MLDSDIIDRYAIHYTSVASEKSALSWKTLSFYYFDFVNLFGWTTLN